MRRWLRRNTLRLVRWFALKTFFGKTVEFGVHPDKPPVITGRIMGIRASEDEGIVATIVLADGTFRQLPIHELATTRNPKVMFHYLEGL